MSPAQCGFSIGFGFMLVMFVPGCAVPVVVEPVVVSVVCKLVSIKPGDAVNVVMI